MICLYFKNIEQKYLVRIVTKYLKYYVSSNKVKN